MKRTYQMIVTISLGLVVFAFLWGMFLMGLAWAAPSVRPLYAPCQVTTTADNGAGSLRECLQNAANGDTITFDPTVFLPGSPATIALTSALPAITQGSLTIDGTGAGVILDGSACPNPWDDGFYITSDGNVINDLQIYNFPSSGVQIDTGAKYNTISNSVISSNAQWGVDIQGAGTMSNTVIGNMIGTNASGTVAMGNGFHGVGIRNGAQYNVIGGDTPGERNIISGNFSVSQGDGVIIDGSGTDYNIVSGNYIGIDVSGTAAIPNSRNGVSITGGASNNTIGGDTLAKGNLISGNDGQGVSIWGNGTDNNVVSANFIGTDVNGNSAMPNITGVGIGDGAQFNTVGGITPGERNVIAGNTSSSGYSAGVWIDGVGTMHNVVIGNYVGTNASGTMALGNGDVPDAGDGVTVQGDATQNIIGGDTPGERNLISGNNGNGVGIGGSNNTISGNYIGTDVTGTNALPNAKNGIQVGGGTNNTIGGSNGPPGGACSGECNLISGNTSVGLTIENSGTDNNIVNGNYIGTDINGTTAIPNGDNGIYIFNGASNNTIGDAATPAKQNLIRGNTQNGVLVAGSNSLSNTITRNSIYNNAQLGIDLWNGGNTELPAPVISSADVTLGNVTGTACALCTIEIFSDNEDEGRVYEGTTTANAGGNWSFSKGSALTGPNVTATATDVPGNTSEFGVIFLDPICVVTSTADSGAGSLRECLQNAVNGEAITFDPTVFPPGSPATIALNSALPNIITDSLTIDGNNAGVILDGSGTPGGTNCLTIDGADGVTIKGLQISYCPGNGIQIQNGATNSTIGGTNTTPGGACNGDCNLISGNGSSGVFIIDSTSTTVSGNFIGTDVNGTIAISNATGVAITGIATGNLIGGSTPGERNLISGNNTGVSINGSSSTRLNTVSGNYIGTDTTGTLDLGNTGAGVSLGNTQDNTIGGSNTMVGGNCTGECNLISGNDWVGVDIASFGIDTTGNAVSGNYIGTDVTGTDPIPNLSGIDLSTGAKLNLIGGNTADKRNVISGNTYDQVRIQNSGTMSNTVSGNYIGTNGSGTATLNKGFLGIRIEDGTQYNLIGGNNATPGGNCTGECNLISGNSDFGVYIEYTGTMNNTVSGNYIGTDVNGTVAISNTIGVGIADAATGNLIGGDTPGERNLISGNASDGVHIRNSGTMSNTVSGNYIGTNAAGTAALSNDDFGVTIEDGAQYNLIGGNNATPGGNCTGECNLISGSNSELGVAIRNTGSMNNTVSGNYIGTNASGTAPIGNALGGVLIGIGAELNTIGGNTAAERNLISGNNGPGVLIEDMNTTNNTVSDNYIGTDVNGTADLGNGTDGVLIQSGADHNLIGGDTAAERNLISGNDDNGVHVKGVGLMSDAPLLDDVSLTFDGSDQLLNGDFSGGLPHWSTNDDNPSATRSINNVTYQSAPASYQFNRNGELGRLRTWYDTLNQTVVLADPWNPASSNWISVSPDTAVTLSFWYSGTLGEVELWGQLSGGGGEKELIKDVLPPTTTWTPVSHNITIPGNIVSVGIMFRVESDPPTTYNSVSGNYIGTDVNGTAALANSFAGVLIDNGAHSNLIGGTTANERNLISGNGTDGVFIQDSSTMSNTVSGNYIGTDVSGMADLGNTQEGVDITDSSYNFIGGTTSGERNIISGNDGDGVMIRFGQVMSNTVSGNYIGTNVSGTAVISNNDEAVSMREGAMYNLIGGSTPGERNVINGGRVGVYIEGPDSMYNTVSGNYIGTDASGTLPLGNTRGVHIESDASSHTSSHNIIGGANNTPGGNCTGECNLISGNSQIGVVLGGSEVMSNTVSGNYIGTDVNGTTALGNSDDGIKIENGAQFNIIGGDTPGERNLISGNNDRGVEIDSAHNNTVSGNYIGTNTSGAADLGNGWNGVSVRGGASQNLIGGSTSGEGNLISGNTCAGVFIADSNTDNNVVSGNFIGTNASGTGIIGQGGGDCDNDGVSIRWGARYNVIGGDTSGRRNLISGNGSSGIRISNDGTISNTVIGNYIGTDVNGTAALGNADDGIHIENGTQLNLVGGNTVGDRNLISSNGADGVAINGATTMSNTISGNYIGTDVNGIAQLGNQAHGVAIAATSYITIGGTTAGERNIISGNHEEGIIIDAGATHNTVSGNYIGTQADGTSALGNGQAGVALYSGAQFNLIGGDTVGEHNIISYNGIFEPFGVRIEGNNTLYNTLQQNSVYSNVGKGIELINGGNTELPAPIITSCTTISATGTAPTGSTVEIFSDDGNQGRYYHSPPTMADITSGYFSFTLPSGTFTGTNVTAIATDSNGNTSEFSGPCTPFENIIMTILQPKPHGKIGEAVVPMVEVENQSTVVATIQLTGEASGTALNPNYGPHVVNRILPPKSPVVIPFPALTPNATGSYDVVATLAADVFPYNIQDDVTVTVSGTKIDLWIRDTPTDNGDVPSPRHWWRSPDIWVRNADDDGTTHQDPIADQVNWVYVIVRNRGDAASDGADTASVFSHDPSLAIQCNTWKPIDTPQTIASLSPGDTQLFKFPWVPTRNGHKCLFAEITSDDDPVQKPCRVKWDNNLGQRNVNILPGGSGLGGAASGDLQLEVTNIRDIAKVVDVVLDVSEVLDANAVQLDLGSELANRWTSTNGPVKSSGIQWSSGSVITVTNPNSGTIASIPMEAGETQTVTLLVNAPSVNTTTVTVYETIDLGSGLDLADAIVGGNTYVFSTATSDIYLPVIFKNHQ